MNPRMEFHRIPDWESVEVLSVNRVPVHTKWQAHASEEEAAHGQTSTNQISLNGQWQFKLEKSPEDVGEFYREDADLTGFSAISVPGSWEVQGFGEPIYTNTLYPWSYEQKAPCMIRPQAGKSQQPNPPYVPAENPTGCYCRTTEP